MGLGGLAVPVQPLAGKPVLDASNYQRHPRHGSMKRVAAAVGEGASAVRSVHTAIGVRA